MPDINEMGKVNANYGVCGITSSLYALYTHSPGQQQYFTSVGGRKAFVLGKIVEFLLQLKYTNTKMLKEIEAFTRKFDGYGGFNIDQYLKTYKSWSFSDSATDPPGDISVAIHPEAVVAFLRTSCNFRNAREIPLSQTRHEAIIGVTDGDPRFNVYKGLCHYVYKRGNTIYSWGQTFTSVADADTDFKACVMISMSG